MKSIRCFRSIYLKSYMNLFLRLCFVFLLSISANCREIRYVNPPQMKMSDVGEKRVGYRPHRKISPCIRLDQHLGKTVLHNYGHGGSGWTIGPASASYSVDLLTCAQPSLDKNEPIAIVGGGCIGLFTAFELVSLGFNNITIYATQFDDLTSHLAGALVAPIIPEDSKLGQAFIETLAVNSYLFYQEIAQGKCLDFLMGARIMPAYYLDRVHSELECYVGSVMNEPTEVILDFGNGHTQEMVAYDDAIYVDTEIMMDCLHKLLQDQVNFVVGKIENLTDLSEDIVFNCTGLGSTELFSDPNLVPIQGHLIFLENQNPKDLEYMIVVDFDDGKTSSGLLVKRSFYMFPKHRFLAPESSVGILGGTMIEEVDAKELNLEEFNIILTQAKKFYGIDEEK